MVFLIIGWVLSILSVSLFALAPMDTKLHIIYRPEYNITLMGLQHLHPFDSAKYGRVYDYLMQQPKSFLDRVVFHEPHLVTEPELLMVHTPAYLQSLRSSGVLARITEIGFLSWVPNFILQKRLLDPMRYATGGTIMGAQLALKQRAVVVNLSGGYHHAKANEGGGFCVYADIPLAIKALWKTRPDLKVMVVDLDAHQGNGHEAILKNDPRIAIFDIYNGFVYPQDRDAQQYITFDYPVHSGISDAEYLELLRNHLPRALDAFKPDFIIYNAGTDIYEKDRIGQMHISEQGIINRDAFVIAQAKKRATPLLMLLSGGYTKQSAGIIGASLSSHVFE